MNNNKKIANPLTIIAIFSGLAEISGTIVLPLVEKDLQYIYIWFVIGFPILLVILFFITLNFNREALYSPSEYKDEKHFMELIHKSLLDQVEQVEKVKKIKVTNNSNEIRDDIVNTKTTMEELENYTAKCSSSSDVNMDHVLNICEMLDFMSNKSSPSYKIGLTLLELNQKIQELTKSTS